jgi:hypothetical protein
MQDYAQDIVQAGSALAAAVVAEMELEARKPSEKSDAVRRLIGSENPETGKAHSASSAEKIVETDRDYADFLATMRDAVAAKIVARAAYDAAVCAGRLATMEVIS